MTVIPVILSGGSGTRLWPKSREGYPKQLHRLYGQHTLLQHSLCRLQDAQQVLADLARPIVICNNEQRFMVADQLTEVSTAGVDILLEPQGRDTAPAIVMAALRALQRDAEAIIAVFPADHIIQDVAPFQRALAEAVTLAKQGLFVSFGVAPTHAETGYGYIQVHQKGEASPIKAFVEKPNAERAAAYVASGDYYWNSGMFVFPAAELIDEMRALQPDIVTACERTFQGATQDLDFIRLPLEPFVASPKISIDYALMEKTQKAWVVPLVGAGWNDIGSWDALWSLSEKDGSGNVCVGEVIAESAHNCYVNAESRLVALVGVEDLVVVDTADALLVMHKRAAQDVKKVVEKLKLSGRTEFAQHREVHRPWGCYDSIDQGARYQVKRITVKPGASLSLQMHYHRAEHWIVVTGTALVQRGDDQILLSENQSVYIPLGEKHRLTNPGKVPLELIEVQSGSYLGEDDIVRFEDVFGRR